MLDLIIIGAGISGLTAAWKAMRAGLSFRLVEAGPTLGGTISSAFRGGALFEMGPATLAAEHPAVARLLGELGLLESLVGAPVAPNWLNGAHDGKALATLPGGLSQLTRALEQRVRGYALTSSPVRKIAPPPQGWKVDLGEQVLQSRRLVVATSAPHCARLLSSFDLRASELVRGIRCSGLAVLNQVYKLDQFSPSSPFGGGVQLPQDGTGIISSVALLSKPANADGRVGVRIYVGGPGKERALTGEDHYIAEQAIDGLHHLVDFRGRPLASHLTRHVFGAPDFGAGHDRRVLEIEGTVRHWPGLHLTGNWLHQPGMAACIASATKVIDDCQALYRWAC